MDGMFLGLATLFRDIVSEETITYSPAEPSTELVPPPATFLPLATHITASSANETIATVFIVEEPPFILEDPPEDEGMHHTTATGLVVTAFLVLIVVALFVLCFFLRKYCRCAYDLHYNLSYGRVPKGAIIVPTEDQLEAGEVSKRSTLNAAGDSGYVFSSRQASETKVSRPVTPSQQRPPRPPAPPSNRGSLQRHSAEQRPLLAAETGTLTVQPTGLYPAVEPASHHVEEGVKLEAKE